MDAAAACKRIVQVHGEKNKDPCKCGGDGSGCAGCDGVPNSGKVKDACESVEEMVHLVRLRRVPNGTKKDAGIRCETEK